MGQTIRWVSPCDSHREPTLISSHGAGDVVFAKFFRTPAIILNSKEAAIELMEKRSAKYSDRPRFLLLKDL